MEQSKYWNHLYSIGIQKKNTFFPEQFLTYFFFNVQFNEIITNTKEIKLLDIGCGFGRNVSLFKLFTNDITCIDPSTESIEFLKAKMPDIKAFIFKPPLINLEKKFNIIVGCNSLYYIDSSTMFDQYFSNIINKLSYKGIFIFSFLDISHSLLDNSLRIDANIYEVKTEADPYKYRSGQKIYVPSNEIDFDSYRLKLLKKGKIRDEFDGNKRFINVYMCQKLD